MLVFTLWLRFIPTVCVPAYSFCTANSLLVHLPSSAVMADISKTEKVQLHAPALEELRGGKDFSFDIQVR